MVVASTRGAPCDSDGFLIPPLRPGGACADAASQGGLRMHENLIIQAFRVEEQPLRHETFDQSFRKAGSTTPALAAPPLALLSRAQRNQNSSLRGGRLRLAGVVLRIRTAATQCMRLESPLA